MGARGIICRKQRLRLSSAVRAVSAAADTAVLCFALLCSPFKQRVLGCASHSKSLASRPRKRSLPVEPPQQRPLIRERMGRFRPGRQLSSPPVTTGAHYCVGRCVCATPGPHQIAALNRHAALVDEAMSPWVKTSVDFAILSGLNLTAGTVSMAIARLSLLPDAPATDAMHPTALVPAIRRCLSTQ